MEKEKIQKMRRFDKKENLGITLIALVVTIIILLILAGITISQLSGTGIFEKAKEARDKWQNAQNEEEMQIAKYSNEVENYVKKSNRDSDVFTLLYGPITTGGTFTLNDSIEKYDKIVFILANKDDGKYFQEIILHSLFIKERYNDTAHQFGLYSYSNLETTLHFKNNNTIVIDNINHDDANHKIYAIYGVN